MSTGDSAPATSQARRRAAIPADPGEDELARYWSLTPADLAAVAMCRGPDQCRRFALQLCAVRAQGRFLDDYRQAPIKIVNHLSRQLGLPPVLFLDRSGREPAERVQAQRIRRHLGLSRFDKEAEGKLRDWLRAGAVEGRTGPELLVEAEAKLRSWLVVLPGASTLERTVASVVANTALDIFATISERLPEKLRADIDLLLEVPEGDARSSLFRLKDYQKSASAGVIKGDIAGCGLSNNCSARARALRRSVRISFDSSASSGGATMPVTCAVLPSRSGTRWWPATCLNPARR
jgi:hypothetical protein